MNMDMTLKITAKSMKDRRYRWEKSLLFAEGYESLSTGGKNGIKQFPFLKKQCPKLRWNRKRDMEVRAVWKKLVHVRHPLIDLNFGADRAKTAFTRVRNVAYFSRMDGASKRGEAETIRLTAVHDLPNVVDHIPSHYRLMNGKEGVPVFLEDMLKGEGSLLDSFHDELDCNQLRERQCNNLNEVLSF